MVWFIMEEYHGGKVGGHGGVFKTQKRIGELLYWAGMMTDIRSSWLLARFVNVKSIPHWLREGY